MTVKLKDIADKSGFSITTVSRALAGYSDVNAETRQRIMQLAVSMGYQPNQVARQLRSQRTNTLGMIIPANDQGFSDDFFSELMMGVGHAASTHGYDLLLSAQTSTSSELDAYHRLVGGNRVDGVVLARTRQNDARITYLRQLKFPFVVSGRLTPDEVCDFPYVDVDSQTGIKMLVQHFMALGHQHIALLLPPPDIAYTPYRLRGYQEGLAALGVPFRQDYVQYGDLKRSGGYQAAQNLLANHPQVSAIVACNDLMAMGALSAIQEQGLKTPDDIAVAGFDDIPAAEYALSPLTTIHQPIYAIGERLIDMLVQMIQGQPPAEPQILLQPTLVIRESCGFKKKKK